MSIHAVARALTLTIAAVAATGCGGDEDPPLAVDAAGSDGAAVDAAVAIDAVPGPDAAPGLEPTLTMVPCDAPSATIEYYSCAFFLGGGELRVGDVVQFIGCEGHTVRSAAGVSLVATSAAVCYRATTTGTLTYACQQHPENSGSIVVAP